MSLLKKQTNASPFRGLPNLDVNSSRSITQQSAETVQLYYYAAGIQTIDAGQAAGVVVVGQLTFNNIRNVLGSMLANKDDTSLSFTSTALTAEVGESVISLQFVEALDESKGSVRAIAIGALLSNGQYYVDYVNGTIYGKKATTQTSLTSTSYKYPAEAGSGTGSSASQVQGNIASGVTDSGNPVKTGGKYNLTPPTLSDGQRGDTQLNSEGDTKTAEQFAAQCEDNINFVYAEAIRPLATSTYSWTRFQNLGANATLNVKASAGNVRSLYCHNINGAARFIQIHNTATIPGGGAVPIYSFLVPAGGTTTIDGAFFGENGMNFSTGIAFAFSTTEATYTAGTATDQFTFIQYA